MKIKNHTYLMVISGLCVALTAVCAQLIVILPFTPVQITLSLCAVYMTGVLLPKRWAVYSQIAYILLGGIGIPIFGKFSGGLGVLAGPTGGYILVYPIMALIVAAILEKFSERNPLHYMLAMFISLVVCYIGGSIWFCFVGHVDLIKSLSLTVLPFIPFDLVKIAFCGFFAQALIKALSKQKQLFA
jgi:biotin transport system substrate-specific component